MKDTTLKITITEEEITKIQKKYGDIEDGGDLYDAVMEALDTYYRLNEEE